MLAAGAKEIFSLYQSWNLMKCEMERATFRNFGSTDIRTNSCVVDVVVGCDHAKVEGREVHLILNGDAL